MRYNNLMNAVDLKQERDANLAVETQSEHGYRSISKAAVACLVFGILSLLSFLGSVFIILPVYATDSGRL